MKKYNKNMTFKDYIKLEFHLYRDNIFSFFHVDTKKTKCTVKRDYYTICNN